MLLPSLRLSDAQGSNSSEVSGFKEVLLSYTAHVQGCDDGVRQHIGEELNPSQAAAASGLDSYPLVSPFILVEDPEACCLHAAIFVRRNIM